MNWHSVKGAAKLLGVSEQLTYRLCVARRLGHRRVGLRPGRGRIEISDEGIAAYLKSCEVEPETEPKGKGKPPRVGKAPTLSGRPDGKPLRDWLT